MNKNKIFILCGIILTVIIIIVLFFVIISSNNNVATVTTTDYIFSLKNEYLGNASTVSKILEGLEIPKLGTYEIELKTSERPYILTVNFNKISTNSELFIKQIEKYATIILALIGNADEVYFNVLNNPSLNYKVSVNEINLIYGDIKNYSTTVDKFHSLLVGVGYYN